MSDTEKQFLLEAHSMKEIEEALEIDKKIEDENTSQNCLTEYFCLNEYCKRRYSENCHTKIWKFERPDFIIHDEEEIGLEITSVVSEHLKQNLAECKKRGMTYPFPLPSHTAKQEFGKEQNAMIFPDGTKIMIGWPTTDDINDFLGHITCRLEKKSDNVRKYDVEIPIHLLIDIDTTPQEIFLHLDKFFLRGKERMKYVIKKLRERAIEEMKRNEKIEKIFFLECRNSTLIEVHKSGKMLCSGKDCIPKTLDDFLEDHYRMDF